MKITPLQPFGAVIHSDKQEQSILQVPQENILQWLNEHFLLVFRGYKLLDDSNFITFAKQFGKLLSWEFGEILELKIHPNPPNHIFTSGRVELHWDGAFVEQKPHYNLFQCLQGSDSNTGGRTLFVNGVDVLQNAAPEERALWQAITINYKTEKKAHYGGSIRSPLVCTNPYTDRSVIRYIEAFNEDNAEINPMNVRVEGYSQQDSDAFLKGFTHRLYKKDVMYQHVWKTGDFAIADNSHLLHGRSRFTRADAGRHIKRINIL